MGYALPLNVTRLMCSTPNAPPTHSTCTPTSRPHLDDVIAVVRHLFVGHTIHRCKRAEVDRPSLRQLPQNWSPEDVVWRYPLARCDFCP